MIAGLVICISIFESESSVFLRIFRTRAALEAWSSNSLSSRNQERPVPSQNSASRARALH